MPSVLNLKYIPENFDDSDYYDESVFYNDVAALNAPFEVDQVSQDSHAERIGLKPGDVFIRINETPVTSIDEFGDILSQFANDSVVIYLARDGKEVLIETVVPEDRRLGFIPKPFMDYTTKRKTLSESAMYGIRQPFRIFLINLKAFSAFFGEAEVKSSRLSGPVSIDQLYGEGSWLSFLRVTALLLAVFAGLEFFPLPKTALTRCIPLISEGLIRRRLSFEYYAQIEKVLWILIFCWFIWSIIQDILKIF